MGKAGFQIASFVVIMAGALLLFLDRGTAEYYVTAASFLVGLLFISFIWFVVRKLSK
jgi:hypothetical protein